MCRMRYPFEFRLKVLAAYDRGLTAQQAADKFDICRRTVVSFLKRRRDGDLAPRKCGPKKPTKVTEEDLRIIREFVEKNPGTTLLKLIDQISVNVAESTMSRTLKRLRITLKKSR